MNFKFATPLLFGSALALGSMGFVACSGDNGGGNPVNPGSSSSNIPEPLPDITETTSIEFSDLSTSDGFDKVKFRGSITIKYDDSTVVADQNAVRFTDLQFNIISANKTSTGAVTVGVPKDFVNTQVTSISLTNMVVSTDLTDPTYTECGPFFLYITATADDGTNKSVSRDSIAFTRDEQYCKIPESSSSSVQVPAAPLTPVEMTINTKTSKCLILATGEAVATETGDICFTRVGTTIQLSSKTGLKFAVYDNNKDNNEMDDYTSSFRPELVGTPTTDSFRYTESALKDVYPDFLSDGDVFFVAIGPGYVPNTGSAKDFYAFVVNADILTPDSNGDRTIPLLVYKAAQ